MSSSLWKPSRTVTTGHSKLHRKSARHGTRKLGQENKPWLIVTAEDIKRRLERPHEVQALKQAGTDTQKTMRAM